MRVLIVGGVAAGASAAARLRRLNESAEIIMFEKGSYISFANCGLPYFVGDVIQSRDDILVQTPESMRGRFNIEVRTNSEVTAVRPNAKTVLVEKDGKTAEEHYDALVLAPGAKPIVPPIPGVHSSRVLTVRSVEDAEGIKARARGARSAVVIGGGYIGVEMAENLAELGIAVTMAEAAPHVLAPFDSDFSPMLEQEMQQHGVRLILGNGVSGFEETDAGLVVALADGQRLTAELCVLAIGVRPDTDWLRESGLALGPKGHIVADEHMRTNLQDVYAAGDAVSVKNFVTGAVAAIPLAGPANRQGRIAAGNIMGGDSVYAGSLGTSIIKVFGLTAAATGANERTLQAAGIPYRTALLHPNHHADYYPGAERMHLKVLYGEDGKVLGAQAVGPQGADKFVDVIATVIRLGGTVEDLAELELAYAPAYLTAKSPANYAGFIACNERAGLVENVPPLYMDALPEDEVLLDVRKQEEYDEGRVEGSVHIPLNELRDRVAELEPHRGKTLVVFCAAGLRGYVACRMLAQRGFRVKNVLGGYLSYTAARFVPQK